jgi:hypothetical protein
MNSEMARVGAVQGWIRDGEKDEALAVFSASPFASGIPKKLYAELRIAAEAKWAPEAVAARAALAKLKEQMVGAGQTYYSRYASTVPSQPPQAVRSTEALARLKKGAA